MMLQILRLYWTLHVIRIITSSGFQIMMRRTKLYKYDEIASGGAGDL